jgi:hypothetical protein
LHLKCDILVSKFAFKFNLYRYSAVFHGLGEGSLAAGVSTPHADDVANLVDRLLAAAAAGTTAAGNEEGGEGRGGEGAAAAGAGPGLGNEEGGEGGEVGSLVVGVVDKEGVDTEDGQRRANAYGEVVRDRALRRLEVGAAATAAEAAAATKSRGFFFGFKKKAAAAAAGENGEGAGGNAAPLVLVSLVAPPAAAADGPHAKVGGCTRTASS